MTDNTLASGGLRDNSAEPTRRALSERLSVITVVTCYYIVPNKRPHQEYKKWIKNFLAIPCNMYIFTDIKTLGFLKKIRPKSHNTYYHVLPLENFYVSKYDDLWKYSLSIDIERQRQNINHTIELYKIWAEKIFMCREAINNNVFDSEIFCWSDIGSVRYSDMIPEVFKFPHALPKHLQKDRVMLSEIYPIQDSDYNFDSEISIIFKNIDDKTSCNLVNRIQGGFFAGYIEPLLQYADMYDKELELFWTTKTFAGKDQHVMTNLYLKNKDFFQLTSAHDKFYYKDLWLAYLMKFSDVPFITCIINGGLGNQLFQISHALCLAWKYNCVSVFDNKKTEIYNSSDTPRPNYWNSLFTNLFLLPLSIIDNWNHITENEKEFNKIDNIITNSQLHGYWQSSRYFYGYDDKLKKMFGPSPIIKNYLQQKIPTNCTAIHIRRTDYVSLKWNLPLEYYQQCIQEELKRDPNVNFLIFSDDHNWCKTNLVSGGLSGTNLASGGLSGTNLASGGLSGTNLASVPIFDIGNEIIQLYALSLCNNVIMANSSFSWWGVFLNTTTEKRYVYAPTPWFPSFQVYNPHIYEKDWKLINIKF